MEPTEYTCDKIKIIMRIFEKGHFLGNDPNRTDETILSLVMNCDKDLALYTFMILKKKKKNKHCQPQMIYYVGIFDNEKESCLNYSKPFLPIGKKNLDMLIEEVSTWQLSNVDLGRPWFVLQFISHVSRATRR